MNWCRPGSKKSAWWPVKIFSSRSARSASTRANPTRHVENTPKIVGGLTPTCHKLAVSLYSEVIEQVVSRYPRPKPRRLAKLLENTFRAVNIGLVNEMAVIADRLGHRRVGGHRRGGHESRTGSCGSSRDRVSAAIAYRSILCFSPGR